MEVLSVLLTLGAVQLAAVASPGPNFFLVSQSAARRGRRQGLSAAAGVCTGAVLWCAAALAGLEIILRQAPWIINALQVLGGCFLIWTGTRLWRAAGTPMSSSDTPANPFWRGFATSVANPKVILFFGSMLSAVFDPALPAWTKFAAFGIIAFNEVWWYLAVVYLFSTARMQSLYRSAAAWLDRVFGSVMIGFGLRLCWTARP